MEEQTITLDGKTYPISSLTDGAKFCLQQIQNLQEQITTSRLKLDQLLMAEKGFLDALRQEVKKEQ